LFAVTRMVAMLPHRFLSSHFISIYLTFLLSMKRYGEEKETAE